MGIAEELGFQQLFIVYSLPSLLIMVILDLDVEK
jgi:hypothetical protein